MVVSEIIVSAKVEAHAFQIGSYEPISKPFSQSIAW